MRVLVAPGRAERPDAFAVARSEPAGPEGCPLCEGQEAETPPEVFAERPGGGEPDGPGWTTRVVPNLYPALVAEGEGAPGRAVLGAPADAGSFTSAGDPLAASRRGGEGGLFGSRPATGAHEVIVNAPEHVTAMSELGEEQFAAAVAIWRERMRAHAEASYVALVVNEGRRAGATLEHTHAQLYALPFVPASVARERERAGAYQERTAGGSLLSDVLVEEVRRRDRLVAIDEEAALICPWASRSPYELRLLPRSATPSFADDTGGAAMLRRALRGLAELLGGPTDLNLWVRTAPRGAEAFSWHIDIVPRVEARGGFELGTDVDINSLAPEAAAAQLREIITA